MTTPTRSLDTITAELAAAAASRADIAARELSLALAAAGLIARAAHATAHYIRYDESDQTAGDIAYAALVDADGNDIDGSDEDLDLVDAMWDVMSGLRDSEVAPFTMKMQQGGALSKRPPYAGSDYLLVIDAMIAADPGEPTS